MFVLHCFSAAKIIWKNQKNGKSFFKFFDFRDSQIKRHFRGKKGLKILTFLNFYVRKIVYIMSNVFCKIRLRGVIFQKMDFPGCICRRHSPATSGEIWLCGQSKTEPPPHSTEGENLTLWTQTFEPFALRHQPYIPQHRRKNILPRREMCVPLHLES